MTRAPDNIFLHGPVPAELVTQEIAQLARHHQIGAHSLFIGQVRNDVHKRQPVMAIRYTAYETMANEKALEICRELSEKFALEEIRIWHSLGDVKAGEISLFVLVAARHRRAALDACSEAVERLKKELPVWGQELYADNFSLWKENT